MSDTPSASAKASSEAVRTFALVGNPNSGKTTLFNALTGLRQKTGNYPGVTVEKKEGIVWSQHGKPMRVYDLPGAYSLSPRSPDEAIAQEVLLGRRPETHKPDAVVCTIDATNLERNLFLATHILEIGLPVILVLNMMDEARAQGWSIDIKVLEKRFGCVVIPCVARKREGLLNLRVAMSRTELPVSGWKNPAPSMFKEAVDAIASALEGDAFATGALARAEAGLLLEGGEDVTLPGAVPIDPATLHLAQEWQERLDRESPGWRSDRVAGRYHAIGEVCREAVRRHTPGEPTLTEKLDKWLLHPVFGWVALAAVMSVLFYSIFSVAAPFMDMVDGLFGMLGEAVANAMPEGLLRDLLVDGIIAGVGGVVIFLPQILILFFFISMLEGTGYLARAAFIVDRIMSKVGLHGKSFIPLLSSNACAVPGIMATRTIESPKDRLVTILVAPFQTCSARLPVYLVMIAALAGGSATAGQQAGLLLLLYALGTGGAFFFAWIFKKTLMRGVSQGVVMELPPYRPPSWRQIGMEMLDRAKIFLRRAGTVIMGMSIILWFLLTFPRVESGDPTEQLQQSFAGQVGQSMEPVFAPLGFDWKINIGVLASFAAREVFVSTMAITYHVEEGEEETENLISAFQHQTRADGSPVFTPLTCLSLMVFFVYALQCVSTIAIVKRETNSWRWPLFQLAYMSFVAYFAALIVYQGGKLLGYE